MIKLGIGTYGETINCPWPQANLTVGNYCSIGHNVQVFLGGNHRKEWISTYNFKRYFNLDHDPDGHPSTKGDVVIGNDVWLGQDITIMSGVTISDGAVVGAKAVVASDVEPYAIVVGNPAKCIGYRFDPSVISKLLKLRWWDWEYDKIKRNIHILCSELTLDKLNRLEREA